jgi:hypothetical protein
MNNELKNKPNTNPIKAKKMPLSTSWLWDILSYLRIHPANAGQRLYLNYTL